MAPRRNVTKENIRLDWDSRMGSPASIKAAISFDLQSSQQMNSNDVGSCSNVHSSQQASSSASSTSGDSSTLVNETVRLQEHDECRETTNEDRITVLLDEPGFRREMRTSKTGRKYLIETRGLWTTLQSLTPYIKQRTVRERLRKRLKEFKIFWPFVLRFATEVLKLGRWRFLCHLIGSTVTGLVPVRNEIPNFLPVLRSYAHHTQALRIYLSSRLISIAQTASEKRVLYGKTCNNHKILA